ncbi:hypothetical protein QZH41_014112 [Actinostola sp. cb2023]|nr:hypothetical protein QZH41_014112 [Actinostola sp. cb2023]
MDVRKPKAAAQGKTFVEEFSDLTRRIKFFKDCYMKSKCLISQIEGVFKNDLSQTSGPESIFITSDEKAQLEDFVTKRASVLVIGQTNSGKSSLINELLGSSYLPTSEVPCTSRIVRIRYSEKNFLTVREATGETRIQPIDFKKSIPKAEIALEDDNKRRDKQWARCLVEVGLNNPLLQGGHLEFVDAPGMSENEVLDSIVQECVHGILQVLIYVIDGNSSLRTQDREFLYNLKQKIGAIPIFFVCNKVDVDERAAEFDRDDDDDESYLNPENQLKIIQGKKMRVFSALVRSHIIEKELDDVDTCEFFHAVSTREVRKARRKRKSPDYVLREHISSFERMKRCFLTFASENIVSHVSNVSRLLGGIQQRIFDFYVSRLHVNLEMFEIQKMIASLRHVEESCFQKMRQYVLENSGKIESVLATAISRQEEKILTEAEDMEFAPIVIADVVHRNEIVNQYKGQIQKMVLMAALNVSLKSATKTVRAVSSNLREHLRRSLLEASKKGGLTGKLVKQQLRHSDVLTNAFCGNDFINMAIVKDYSLMTLTYKTLDPPKTFISDVMSIIKGTTVDKAWKRKTAKNVLDNVDRSKLTDRIIGALLDNLHDGHHTYTMNLHCIENLSEKASKQTKNQEQVISEYGPPFAEVLCLNDALLETITNSALHHLENQIGEGNRGTVYDWCTTGEFSEKQLVAKQFHPNISNIMYLSIQHALKRLEEVLAGAIDEEHPNVMRLVSLVLIDNEITLLLPRLHTDLYTALSDGSIKTLSRDNVETRLIILKQMAGACKFCREKGLQLIDPRITNVLLDEQCKAVLNISKPRDDSVCYPDGLAPFHVRGDPPPLIYASNRVLQVASQHDVYALGIMGWLLAVGEYKRPTYANTTVLIDSPGRNENEALDRVVEEFVHKGIVPLIVYVVDGNQHIRENDRTTIRELQDKFPNVSLMFVCSKVDIDKQAQEYDNDDDKQDLTDRYQLALKKKIEVFRQLKASYFLARDEEIDASLHFHGVSARNVEKARKHNEQNNDTRSFDRLHCCILEKLENALMKDSKKALGNLLSAQEMILCSVISARKSLSLTTHLIPSVCDQALKTELLIFQTTLKLGMKSDEIKNTIRRDLEQLSAGFLDEGENYQIIDQRTMRKEFQTIQKTAGIDPELLKQVRIEELLVMEFTSAIKGAIVDRTFNVLKFSIHMVLKEVLSHAVREMIKLTQTVRNPLIGRLVKRIFGAPTSESEEDVNDFLQLHRILDGLLDSVDAAVNSTLRREISIPLSEFDVNEVGSNPRPRDAHWRRKVVQTLLSKLDFKRVASSVIESCDESLLKLHKLFRDSVENYRTLNTIFDGANLTTTLQHLRSKYVPRVAELAVRGHSLRYVIERGVPELGVKIKSTAHGEIYSCASRHWCWDQKECMVKVVTKSEVGLEVWCQTMKDCINSMNINYRLGECCRYHLQLHGWYYLPDHDQLYIVMEKAECDLLTALRNSGLQSWKRRKEVAIDVAKGLEAIHKVEYVYQDVKAQNIMLTANGTAKLNLAKPEKPFEDTKLGVPFHISPEMFQNHGKDASSHTFDVYAFGSLLWVLCEGSGNARPKAYSHCQDIEAMKFAVCNQGLKPERPHGTPDAWWVLMSACWTSDADVKMDALLKNLANISTPQ